MAMRMAIRSSGTPSVQPGRFTTVAATVALLFLASACTGAAELGEPVETVELDGFGWEVFVPDAPMSLVVATATPADRMLVIALAASPDELSQLIESVFQPALGAFQEE